MMDTYCRFLNAGSVYCINFENYYNFLIKNSFFEDCESDCRDALF